VEAVKEITAAELGMFVLRLDAEEGGIDDVISDRGSSLNSEEGAEVFVRAGVKHIKTTAYNPQSDPAEAAVKKIKGQLLKIMHVSGKTWDLNLHGVAKNANSAV